MKKKTREAKTAARGVVAARGVAADGGSVNTLSYVLIRGEGDTRGALTSILADEIGRFIFAVLCKHGGKWRFFSHEMAEAIKEENSTLGEHGESLDRRCGKVLARLRPAFDVLFDIGRNRLLAGKRRYYFRGFRGGDKDSFMRVILDGMDVAGLRMVRREVAKRLAAMRRRRA